MADTTTMNLLGVGIAVVWLLCAIFSSVGARQRNRSEFGWFLIGLFFGFFGLLVFAMPLVVEPGAKTGRNQAPVYTGQGVPMWVSFVGVAAVVTVMVGAFGYGGENPLGFEAVEESFAAVYNYLANLNPVRIL